MDFLKRHYEKIILATLLITFLALLVYLINIITSTAEVSSESLKIPTPAPDYDKTDFTSSEFNIDNTFTREMYWLESQPRNKNSHYYTDLIIPVTSARCPHCKKIVPEFYFLNAPHKCFFCKGDLPKPPDEGKPLEIDQSLVDTDEDGIPDMVEKRFGLNPNDPKDADSDLDGDGFTNLFEYQSGTDMNDPKSHPAMYLRLQMVELRQEQLPIILQKVSAISKQKKHWDIQINFTKSDRSRFYLYGDMLPVEGKEYKIIDVIPKYSTNEVTDNVAVNVDESQIIIQSQDKTQEKITLTVGQPAYFPRPKAVILDVTSQNEYKLSEGQRFSIGNERTGVYQYMVKQIDTANVQVLLDDYSETPKKIWVTKERQIPPVVTAGTERQPMMTDDAIPRDADPGLSSRVPRLPSI